MKHQVVTMQQDFEIIAGTSRSQAATMVLAAGESTGGLENRHAQSDQWLYVIAGKGMAVVNGREVHLRPGSLLLVEQGEAHEITNTADRPLETINIYTPPAY
ncbi:MAG: cupin domain-containing protein [Chloroflexi bacterium]|nr:cupin domain-containing protein [Chloroflexota bacterium]